MNPQDNFQQSFENRKYQRLKSAFPVQFTIVRLQGDLPGIDWLEGSTKNVSKGGLCLETTQLNESIIKYLSKQNIFLDIKIKTATSLIKAVGEVVWYKKVEGKIPNLYLIGVHFHSIQKPELKSILEHAQRFVVL